MKPLWDELSEAADTMALAGVLDRPTLQILRAAAVQMENWFVANAELREENAAAIKRIREQDAALRVLDDLFFHASKFARHEITMDAFGTCVIDKVPFLNAMAAHGRDGIGAPVKQRKKKETI